MLRINTCRARHGRTFPALRRHRQADLCESAVSLVYIKSSRLHKATQYDCLENENERSALEQESKLLPSKGLHFIPPTPFQLTSNYPPTRFCLGHCFFLGTGGRRYAQSRNSGLLCQRATGWDQEINKAVDSREITDPFVTQLTTSATSVKIGGEVETLVFIGRFPCPPFSLLFLVGFHYTVLAGLDQTVLEVRDSPASASGEWRLKIAHHCPRSNLP